MAVLLLPPLLVRGLLLEAYAIQSDSMNPGFQTGDHLLVLKPALDTREVARWDVVMADRSVDLEVAAGVDAIIKRVVGLPGEWIEIRDGDVWVRPADAPATQPLAIARKPDDVTRGLLVTAHTSTGLQSPWNFPKHPAAAPGAPAWVRLDAGPGGASGPVRATFEGPVLDGQWPADGQGWEGGEVEVNDTAVELVLGEVTGTLEIVLQEKPDVFTVRLPPAGEGPASIHHNLSASGVVATTTVEGRGLSGNQTVLAWNVDNGVRVFVDGELWLSWDYAANEPRPPGTAVVNAPSLRVTSGAVEIRWALVLRDLHYSAQGTHGTDPRGGLTPARVPPDGLFLLGDASRQSRDSRYFGPIPGSAVRGRPLAIYSPWARHRWLGPAGFGPRSRVR